jgi:nucleotidyltransferase substrate binding protein (TIGR01987 family)
MTNNTFTLENYNLAIDSLNEAIVEYKNYCGKLGESPEKLMRDGVIQRFEYTYELSWKTLKKYIKKYEAEQVEQLNIKDIYRLAAKKELIKDVTMWFDFHERRNMTSHLYSNSTAKQVYSSIELFLHEAKTLRNNIKNRL